MRLLSVGLGPQQEIFGLVTEKRRISRTTIVNKPEYLILSRREESGYSKILATNPNRDGAWSVSARRMHEHVGLH